MFQVMLKLQESSLVWSCLSSCWLFQLQDSFGFSGRWEALLFCLFCLLFVLILMLKFDTEAGRTTSSRRIWYSSIASSRYFTTVTLYLTSTLWSLSDSRVFISLYPVWTCFFCKIWHTLLFCLETSLSLYRWDWKDHLKLLNRRWNYANTLENNLKALNMSKFITV